MNKKIKIISLVSAAVLAVSPLITTPVNAATNATTTSNSVKNSEIYFTYNGEKIPDNGTVPLKQGLPIKEGETLYEIYQAAKETVKLTVPNSTTDVNYDPSEIANQLRDQNVSFVGGERSAAKIIAPITGFTLKLTGSYVNQAGDRKNTTV